MNTRVLLMLCLAASSARAQTIDLGNGIALTGKVIPFDSTKHTISRCKKFNWNYEPVCLIDGKPYFGHDLGPELPRMELTSLRVTIRGKPVTLDISGMFNPSWNVELRPDQFKARTAEGGHQVVGLFSDGAGTYVAVWKIIAGGSIRSVLSNDESDVVHWWHKADFPTTGSPKR